ncbi:MAG: NRAMP family divalent metal transporter [Xanthobacteraceae bacterium]
MTKLLEISLGVVTSIGGFLEAGSLATAVQAGAAFHFQLIWAIVLGTICIIFLVEMAGRFAAVSRHTIADGIRHRFGFNFFVVFLASISLVNLLVLSAEIGAVCLALKFITGIGIQFWVLPVAAALWLMLWKGTFGLVEQGVSFLGLVTLCFVVAAFMLQPPCGDVTSGALPSLPQHHRTQYWFMAASILGASISPYLFLFYSAGAIEDKWDKGYLGANRAIAGFGMSFGGTIAIAALIVAAMVFPPQGITKIDSYDQIATMLIPVFGHAGFILFALSLGIACFGAALEISLQQAYVVAQGFGWNWGENLKPKDDPGFAATYTLFILLGCVPVVAGLDPLKLTMFAMALTAASLPVAIVPFLLLLNDRTYVEAHGNGRIGNAAVLFIVVLACVLAVVSIPLQILGGS